MSRFWLLALLAPASLAAQTPPPPRDSARDAARPAPERRTSWISDRRPLRVGDLLTIVVDERVTSAEQNSKRGGLTRKQGGTFDLKMSATSAAAPKTFGIGYEGKSDESGQANRIQDLSAVLSVRVIALEPGGVARIEGRRTVSVDGRKLEVVLQGTVRPEDVPPGNVVRSSRIADAMITYKGKSIGPKSGIFGKILGMLWP
jgi:flagellar L-ring protein precursor FlgH